MTCLAIDTTGRYCSVALFDPSTDTIIRSSMDDLGRGHAEHLLPTIQQHLDEADISYSDLSKIITTIGPGSFTGVRVGLSSARGLGLGLDIPVVGVSVLEALEHLAIVDNPSSGVATILDARREEYFVRWPTSDGGVAEQTICDMDGLVDKIGESQMDICGAAATTVSDTLGEGWTGQVLHTLDAVPVDHLARFGDQLNAENFPPNPLYLRKADAKPQTGFTGVQRA